MRKEYASELTREDLIKMGVVAVDLENCRVYGQQSELIPIVNAANYLMINLYEVDDNGDKIKIPYKKRIKGCNSLINTYLYKTITVSLNRLLWAWKWGKVKAGYVIDHINNKHENLEDYKLSNLQEITPAENIAKERDNGNFLLRPGHGKDISYYEAKLNHYLELYNQAKKEHNADKVHKLRGCIANQRAKIRYIQKYGRVF